MTFKTVEWVRRVRDERYKRTKDMSFEDRVRLYHEKAAALRRKTEQVRKKVAASSEFTAEK